METPPPLPPPMPARQSKSAGPGKALLIIGGCLVGLILLGVVATLLGVADEARTPSPESLAQTLASRGYPTKYLDRQFEVEGLGRIAVKELRVYNHGVTPGNFTALERIGGIFYVSTDYTEAQLARIAITLEGRAQRGSGVIYFRPYKDDYPDDLAVADWLRMFK